MVTPPSRALARCETHVVAPVRLLGLACVSRGRRPCLRGVVTARSDRSSPVRQLDYSQLLPIMAAVRLGSPPTCCGGRGGVLCPPAHKPGPLRRWRVTLVAARAHPCEVWSSAAGGLVARQPTRPARWIRCDRGWPSGLPPLGTGPGPSGPRASRGGAAGSARTWQRWVRASGGGGCSTPSPRSPPLLPVLSLPSSLGAARLGLPVWTLCARRGLRLSSRPPRLGAWRRHPGGSGGLWPSRPHPHLTSGGRQSRRAGTLHVGRMGRGCGSLDHSSVAAARAGRRRAAGCGGGMSGDQRLWGWLHGRRLRRGTATPRTHCLAAP